MWWKSKFNPLKEEDEMDIENVADNQDQTKCRCWLMQMQVGEVMVKAMRCGSEWCKLQLNKDIWNVTRPTGDSDSVH